MDPITIGLWVNLLSSAIPLGVAIVNGIKSIMSTQGLTNEQINGLEGIAIAEATARKHQRELMGQPS